MARIGFLLGDQRRFLSVFSPSVFSLGSSLDKFLSLSLSLRDAGNSDLKLTGGDNGSQFVAWFGSPSDPTLNPCSFGSRSSDAEARRWSLSLGWADRRQPRRRRRCLTELLSRSNSPGRLDRTESLWIELTRLGFRSTPSLKVSVHPQGKNSETPQWQRLSVACSIRFFFFISLYFVLVSSSFLALRLRAFIILFCQVIVACMSFVINAVFEMFCLMPFAP